MLPLFFLLLFSTSCIPAESNSSNSLPRIAFLSNSDQVHRNQNQTMRAPKRLPSSRIIGGSPARIDEFPFIILVHDSGSLGLLFGGTLIQPAKVLTACHCVLKNITNILGSNYTVLGQDSLLLEAGLVDIQKIGPHRQQKRSQEIVVHPKCRFGQAFFWEYDVAVITALSDFKINEHVSLFPSLAKDAKVVNQMTKDRVTCTTLGWGTTSSRKTEPSNVLMKVSLTLLPFKTCKVMMNDHGRWENLTNVSINDKCQICTLDRGKDIGIGDSGGPLICNKLLVGIVSYSTGFGDYYIPTVHARVDVALPWILTGKEKTKRWLESRAGSIFRSDVILLTSMWAQYMASDPYP